MIVLVSCSHSSQVLVTVVLVFVVVGLCLVVVSHGTVFPVHSHSVVVITVVGFSHLVRVHSSVMVFVFVVVERLVVPLVTGGSELVVTGTEVFGGAVVLSTADVVLAEVSAAVVEVSGGTEVEFSPVLEAGAELVVSAAVVEDSAAVEEVAGVVLFWAKAPAATKVMYKRLVNFMVTTVS